MTTGTKNQVNHPGEYLETLDSYADLDQELLPVFNDRILSSVSEVADAVEVVDPDAAQDTRYWLLSAMQRDLVVRSGDGRFELSDEGLKLIQ